MANYVDM